MRARSWTAGALGLALCAHVGQVPAQEGEAQWGGLPPGEGRPVVYAYCTACHSTRIILQQGMSRSRWDQTLDWMVKEQGMPEPGPEAREVLLDYLAAQFPAEQPRESGGVSPYRTLPPLR